MARSLLPIFVALILLFVSHSAKAQQLPDSLLAKNEPMMLLPDSNNLTLSIVAAPNTIPFGGWWPALTASGGEGISWIPPNYTLTCYPFTECAGCFTVTFDTLLLIPHADSFLGAKAAVVTPAKIPDAAEAAGFAGSFHRFTKKEEE